MNHYNNWPVSRIDTHYSGCVSRARSQVTIRGVYIFFVIRHLYASRYNCFTWLCSSRAFRNASSLLCVMFKLTSCMHAHHPLNCNSHTTHPTPRIHAKRAVFFTIVFFWRASEARRFLYDSFLLARLLCAQFSLR